MSANLNKFKTILREMFQFDQADLNFGIYRIMNCKRDEIEQFLDKDLLPQVKTAFETFQGNDQNSVRDQMDKLRKNLEEAGVDPETSPKYQELKQQLDSAVDVVALENEVFSQLTNFFRRYYQGGDFLSLRRYKEGVYAIPYEGEEVKLHWANADQYYIKSSEDFRDYAFTLPSGQKVHFKLVEASTEQNNKKEQSGKERRFVLCEETPVLEQNGELFIRFEYRVVEGKTKQTALNDAAVETVMALVEGDWRRGLTTPAPTAKNAKRTLLQKHLGDYTAKYSFDYFIHKDLGGFLRRELDFFIKNEVLFIDDLDTEHIKASISKAKVIKQIGHKVIAILEQLENFQKKLWLKKKFVVETGYCVTLDRVPEELYPEIVANSEQLKEWNRLFSIQSMSGYKEPITEDFLRNNKYLVLDTVFYSARFVDDLISSIHDLDANINGWIVNSENFQALNLLGERFSGQIKCTYIDPPYNTDASPIMYKNGYKESSWISLMKDRLSVVTQLMKNDGTIAVAIDDEQQRELSFLMSDVFKNRLLGTFCVRSNPSGRPKQTGYSVAHEYVIYAGNSSESVIERMQPTPEQRARFSQIDEDGHFEWRNLRREGSDSNRDDRRYMYYPIYLSEQSIRVPDMEWDVKTEEWLALEPPRPDETVVFPDNEAGEEKRWRWEHKTVTASKDQLAVRKDRSGREYVYYKRRPHQAGVVSVSTWFDAKYSATEHGTAVLKALFNSVPFLYPKSIYAVMDSIYIGGASHQKAYVIDFFAGSGTTGHAVINLNRDDHGNRKYVLVEMGEHFETVLKPRIQKVIYSKDWKDGKPVSCEGSSHMFKYIRLESYEDALNNLQLKRTQSQQELLDQNDPLREQYLLSYMLDVESAGSASLLNIAAFTNPFNYRMNIARGNETKETVIDLVETFNWLLGIKVLRLSAREYRTADFARDPEGRLQIKDRPRSCAAGEGWTFKEVEGETLAGDKVLIIWRTLTDNPEQDNLMLDAWFSKRNYSTLDFEFSRIYVNGDNNLENLKIGEERWKVALIEEEFKRLMFSVEG